MKYLTVILFLAQFEFFSVQAQEYQRGNSRGGYHQSEQGMRGEEGQRRRGPRRKPCNKRNKEQREYQSSSGGHYYAPEYGRKEDYGRTPQEF